MMKFPEINRHWVGIPALALAIIGLGIVGNTAFRHPTASFLQVSSPQPTEPTSAADSDFMSQLKRIPKNAFGSARPDAQLPGNEPRGSSGIVWQPPEEIANQNQQVR